MDYGNALIEQVKVHNWCSAPEKNTLRIAYESIYPQEPWTRNMPGVPLCSGQGFHLAGISPVAAVEVLCMKQSPLIFRTNGPAMWIQVHPSSRITHQYGCTEDDQVACSLIAAITGTLLKTIVNTVEYVECKS